VTTYRPEGCWARHTWEGGSSVNVDTDITHALCKTKIMITCGSIFDKTEMENEADGRLFFTRETFKPLGYSSSTSFLNKDRFVSLRLGSVFHIPREKLEKFPSEHRYLTWAGSKIGRFPNMNLNSRGSEKYVLYGRSKAWLEGENIKPDLMRRWNLQVATRVLIQGLAL
jgi:hypothetical protein